MYKSNFVICGFVMILGNIVLKSVPKIQKLLFSGNSGVHRFCDLWPRWWRQETKEEDLHQAEDSRPQKVQNGKDGSFRDGKMMVCKWSIYVYNWQISSSRSWNVMKPRKIKHKRKKVKLAVLNLAANWNSLMKYFFDPWQKAFGQVFKMVLSTTSIRYAITLGSWLQSDQQSRLQSLGIYEKCGFPHSVSKTARNSFFPPQILLDCLLIVQ